MRRNSYSPSLPWEKTPAIYDEKSEFVCFASVLPYLSPAQEEVYTAIVRRAAELDMMAIARKWNCDSERLIPSKGYKD